MSIFSRRTFGCIFSRRPFGWYVLDKTGIGNTLLESVKQTLTMNWNKIACCGICFIYLHDFFQSLIPYVNNRTSPAKWENFWLNAEGKRNYEDLPTLSGRTNVQGSIRTYGQPSRNIATAPVVRASAVVPAVPKRVEAPLGFASACGTVTVVAVSAST